MLWDTPPPPTRGPKPALTVDAIAAAGIEVAAADGLAAVTMQRVADRLGVTKMALYRYVPGKQDLLAVMIEQALGTPPAPAGAGWRRELDGWARAMFDRFAAHPWAVEATVGPRPIGPNEVGWLELAVAALAGTGLRGSLRLDVAVTLIGHVRTIAQQAAAAGTGSPEQAMHESMGALLAGRADRFPALTQALADPGGKDEALDVGLRIILDGVDALIRR